MKKKPPLFHLDVVPPPFLFFSLLFRTEQIAALNRAKCTRRNEHQGGVKVKVNPILSCCIHGAELPAS